MSMKKITILCLTFLAFVADASAQVLKASSTPQIWGNVIYCESWDGLGEWGDDYLEESWLYEAISETYIPLLTNFKKLVDEGVDFRITMSMTPPLLSMLDNKLLQRKYIKYLKNVLISVYISSTVKYSSHPIYILWSGL